MLILKRNGLLALAIVLLSIACKEQKKNTHHPVEKKTTNEWVYLFDGTSTDGWRAYNGDKLPAQWTIVDGALTFDTALKTEEEFKGGRDIIYAAEEYDNFGNRFSQALMSVNVSFGGVVPFILRDGNLLCRQSHKQEIYKESNNKNGLVLRLRWFIDMVRDGLWKKSKSA